MKKGAWIWIIIGAVILSLIVGTIIGSQLFSKTIEVSPIGKFCFDENYLVKYRGFYDCVKNGFVTSQRKARNEINQYDTLSQDDKNIFSNTIEVYFDSASSLGCYHPRP